jgi:hypothetical protein
MVANEKNKYCNDMKEKIREILVKHSDNKKANDRIEAELLDLFSVRVNEVKLICEHQHGVESCGYKYKDVYTCKHLRNCEMCGN